MYFESKVVPKYKHDLDVGNQIKCRIDVSVERRSLENPIKVINEVQTNGSACE